MTRVSTVVSCLRARFSVSTPMRVISTRRAFPITTRHISRAIYTCTEIRYFDFSLSFYPSLVPSIYLYASFFSSGDKRARKREREERRERGEATRILLSRSTLVSKYTRLSFMSTPRRKRAILRLSPLPLVETETRRFSPLLDSNRVINGRYRAR